MISLGEFVGIHPSLPATCELLAVEPDHALLQQSTTIRVGVVTIGTSVFHILIIVPTTWTVTSQGQANNIQFKQTSGYLNGTIVSCDTQSFLPVNCIFNTQWSDAKKGYTIGHNTNKFLTFVEQGKCVENLIGDLIEEGKASMEAQRKTTKNVFATSEFFDTDADGKDTVPQAVVNLAVRNWLRSHNVSIKSWYKSLANGKSSIAHSFTFQGTVIRTAEAAVARVESVLKCPDKCKSELKSYVHFDLVSQKYFADPEDKPAEKTKKGKRKSDDSDESDGGIVFEDEKHPPVAHP